jgi:CBS domain-containing protein
VNVGQICQRDVVTARESDDLITAAALMRDKHIGYIVVVEPALREGAFTPVGVLTDRDIVVAVVAQGADPRSLRVGDVMTRKPVVALLEDSLTDALEQMRRIGVRRLPIAGSCGELAGLLSLDDILTSMAAEFSSAARAITTERVVESVRRP